MTHRGYDGFGHTDEVSAIMHQLAGQQIMVDQHGHPVMMHAADQSSAEYTREHSGRTARTSAIDESLATSNNGSFTETEQGGESESIMTGSQSRSWSPATDPTSQT